MVGLQLQANRPNNSLHSKIKMFTVFSDDEIQINFIFHLSFGAVSSIITIKHSVAIPYLEVLFHGKLYNISNSLIGP